MYPLPNWPSEPPKLFDRNGQELLISSDDNDELLHYTDINQFIEISDKFPIKFPIDTGRCKTFVNKVSNAILLRNVNSAYPLLHESVLSLYVDFLLHKSKFGSNAEKKLYKDMNLFDFVDRLLKKRAVMFMGKNDDYILLNGDKGRGKWETIGKDYEEGSLVLENCLSYDEIKLSALLSVSSYSYFVNDGSRRNKGVASKTRNNLQDEGVVIGLIGARMKKKCFMEYQDIVIDPKQNIEKNGYGIATAPSAISLFANFFGKQNLTYADFLKSKERMQPGHYTEITKGVYFDNIAFSKRVTISIETLLFEANHRAKEKQTSAFLHVVGIGLGVWKCSTHQEEVFMETFANRIQCLGKDLHNISDVYFAYFSLSTTCGKYKHGEKIPIKDHPNEGIRVFISQRQPHEALVDDDKDKLLIVSYAWDGNALPGNEFWSGKLASTGDSAAASSTQITEIHNPHINKNVCARNLKIAAGGNIYSIQDYIQHNKKRKHEDDEPSTSG